MIKNHFYCKYQIRDKNNRMSVFFKRDIGKSNIIAIDTKNNKILSVKVTVDEQTHESKMLPEVVDNVTKSNRRKN